MPRMKGVGPGRAGHLAARMEQIGDAGDDPCRPETLRQAGGYVIVKADMPRQPVRAGIGRIVVN